MAERSETRSTPGQIVHDAEYYILTEQHWEMWAAEDKELDTKLGELRGEYGTPPNVVHIMWDDTAFGDAGFPAINKIRGSDTPDCNRMAAEGILCPARWRRPTHPHRPRHRWSRPDRSAPQRRYPRPP